jgi:hypothetical protein
MRSLPNPGDIVAGKYAILRRIGEGGMGVVFEAFHLRLRQRLAIKCLRPDVSLRQEFIARFETEAWIAAQLKTVHTARVIDVDRFADGLPYIVLEYLEGNDLEAELTKVGCLPPEEAVDVVMQVAEAMQEAHAVGVVHRDLKPGNLFVCRAGGRRVMKILDFGIARADVGSTRVTQGHSQVGTPCYASPEQLYDAATADARSDVWSLGIVLYELLVGRPPFQGTPLSVVAKVMVEPVRWPSEVPQHVPAGLVQVVLRALERDAALRFQSMRELRDALAPFAPAESADEVLREVQGTRGRLGEILVADGLVAEGDLQRALAVQRRTGALLGAVLLEMGVVSRSDLLAALAKQQGIPARADGASHAPEAMPIPLVQPKALPERSALTSTPPPISTLPRPRRLRSVLLAVAIGLSSAPIAAAAAGAVHRLAPEPEGAAGVAAMQGVVAAPGPAAPSVQLGVPVDADTGATLAVPAVAQPPRAAVEPAAPAQPAARIRARKAPLYDPKEI